MSKEEWLYGLNPVSEAVRSARKILSLHVYNQRHEQTARIIETARAKGIPVTVEGREFFDRRFQKSHQGIAARVEQKTVMNVNDLLELAAKAGSPPFFLILDCVEDPRNFGAILRVADAAGVNGVVFQSHRSAGITPVVSKASAGALEHINLAEVVNIKHAIEKMKERDIVIIGAEAGYGTAPWNIDLKIPLALVVGSEGKGLRRTVREMCDFLASLPMTGRVNSLNVSVAAGILAYEVVRQRVKA